MNLSININLSDEQITLLKNLKPIENTVLYSESGRTDDELNNIIELYGMGILLPDTLGNSVFEFSTIGNMILSQIK